MEKIPAPEPDDKENSAEHPVQHGNRELVQFEDHGTAFRYCRVGDVVNWDFKDKFHFWNPPPKAIIQTQSGAQFAVCGHKLMQLTESGSESSRFHKIRHRRGAVLLDFYDAPDALPELILGQPWSVLDNDDPVTEVMFEHETYCCEYSGAVQTNAPNPFHEVYRRTPRENKRI